MPLQSMYENNAENTVRYVLEYAENRQVVLLCNCVFWAVELRPTDVVDFRRVWRQGCLQLLLAPGRKQPFLGSVQSYHGGFR